MGSSSARRNKLPRRIVPYHNPGTRRTTVSRKRVLTEEEFVEELWQRASESDRQRMERSPEFMKKLRDAQNRIKK